MPSSSLLLTGIYSTIEASHKWYTLSRVANALDFSSSERDYLEDVVRNLVGFPPGAGIAYQAELPLHINKGRGNDPSAPLYAEDYATAILENLNLHYVATTRPRQALFIYYEAFEEKTPLRTGLRNPVLLRTGPRNPAPLRTGLILLSPAPGISFTKGSKIRPYEP
jgi:hypothetical protein